MFLGLRTLDSSPVDQDKEEVEDGGSGKKAADATTRNRNFKGAKVIKVSASEAIK